MPRPANTLLRAAERSVEKKMPHRPKAQIKKEKGKRKKSRGARTSKDLTSPRPKGVTLGTRDRTAEFERTSFAFRG